MSNTAHKVVKPANVARAELICKPLSFKGRAKRSSTLYAYRDDKVELLAISINASLKAQTDLLAPVVHSFAGLDYGNPDVQAAIKRLTGEGFGVEYLDDPTTIKIIPPVGRKPAAK